MLTYHDARQVRPVAGAVAVLVAALGFGFFILPHAFADHVPVACGQGTHYSFYSTAKIFDAAYAAAPTMTVPPAAGTIKGITVNHHLLAANLIAGMFDQVATDAPVTVILISPNHFSAGGGQVIASAADWQTPYGVLLADCDAVSDLARAGAVSIEESPFEKEHGISGIVPFIKKSLPNARVVPIIVKDSLPEAGRKALADALYKEFGSNVLVVASFDFSHYLPGNEADFHDAKTIAVLQNFDYESMDALDTDSVPGVETTLRFLEKMGATRFDVLAHTNSAKFLADPSVDATTSYIDGIFSVGQKQATSTAAILAFGDLMLDRNVRQRIATQGQEYPFAPLKRFLLGSDIVVANAEGPFTHNTSVAGFDTLQFTFDPAMLAVLKRFGFTLLSQANNHALNFGISGLRESQAAIRANSMDTFGDPMNDDPGPLYRTIRGINVAFIGYHQFMGTDTNVLEAIRAAKARGAFVIVYPHWGVEYNVEVTPQQQEEAHAFIDAGADLILGAHPHVIEPIEVYKGKAIFYSMGNFVFDQYWNQLVTKGLSVGIVLTPDTVSYSLFPVQIHNAQTSLVPYPARATLISDMAKTALLAAPDTPLRTQIEAGVFTLPR